MNDHNQNTPRTEADRTSQTRFGPRPVPKDHLVGGHRARTARGPQPSLLSKIIVWGGVALAVAGTTAGALMATRKIANMIADDPAPQPARLMAARPARASAPAAVPKQLSPARSAQAKPASAPPRNVARELTQTAQDLSGSLTAIAGSLLQAFEGFRRVASEANGIVSEFVQTADQVKTAMRGFDRTPADPPPARPAREARTHRL